MQILLRSIKIIDPNSKHNGETKDVLIVDGTIEKIGNDIDSTEVNEIIEGDAVRLTFRVEDALTGEGLRGMHIASWLCQRPGDLDAPPRDPPQPGGAARGERD